MNNQTHINLDWAEFKSYLSSNIVLFKQIVRNNNYYLFTSDGALTAMCIIPKDGQADQQDYENTYQSRANRNFDYYSTPINIRQSAATAVNATVWAMRNGAAATRKVVIDEVLANVSFDSGTSLIARTLQRYNLVGFNGATPSGGSQLSVVSLDSGNPTTQVADVRASDTGLTTTGISFTQPIATLGCPATDATVSPYTIKDKKIVLAAGEGFAIRLAVAAVVGQGLTGAVIWKEV